MNKGEITDTEMNNILDGIVDSLFSLFATLGKSYTILSYIVASCCGANSFIQELFQ